MNAVLIPPLPKEQRCLSQASLWNITSQTSIFCISLSTFIFQALKEQLTKPKFPESFLLQSSTKLHGQVCPSNTSLLVPMSVLTRVPIASKRQKQRGEKAYLTALPYQSASLKEGRKGT